MVVGDALVALESIAPARYRIGDDPHGLILGDANASVGGITVALDVTAEVLRAAKADGHGLVLAHHPLWYQRTRTLRVTDPFPAPVLLEAMRSEIAVACAHTAWDVAPGGINDVLARLLGLGDIRPLGNTHADALSQFVVYVPVASVGPVRDALFAAGAGALGRYDECSFELVGDGSFRPLEGSQPRIGSHGRREIVRETRIEVVLPSRIAHRVVEAARAAHPYETMAFALHSLANTGDSAGLGRIGVLESPRDAAEFLGDIAQALDFSAVRDSGTRRTIRTVAVIGGAGSSEMAAAQIAGADALVTSDVRHHEFVEAAHRDFLLVDAGHAATETPGTLELARRMADALPDVEVLFRNPDGSPREI